MTRPCASGATGRGGCDGPRADDTRIRRVPRNRARRSGAPPRDGRPSVLLEALAIERSVTRRCAPRGEGGEAARHVDPWADAGSRTASAASVGIRPGRGAVAHRHGAESRGRGRLDELRASAAGRSNSGRRRRASGPLRPRRRGWEVRTRTNSGGRPPRAPRRGTARRVPSSGLAGSASTQPGTAPNGDGAETRPGRRRRGHRPSPLAVGEHEKAGFTRACVKCLEGSSRRSRGARSRRAALDGDAADGAVDQRAAVHKHGGGAGRRRAGLGRRGAAVRQPTRGARAATRGLRGRPQGEGSGSSRAICDSRAATDTTRPSPNRRGELSPAPGPRAYFLAAFLRPDRPERRNAAAAMVMLSTVRGCAPRGAAVGDVELAEAVSASHRCSDVSIG